MQNGARQDSGVPDAQPGGSIPTAELRFLSGARQPRSNEDEKNCPREAFVKGREDAAAGDEPGAGDMGEK